MLFHVMELLLGETLANWLDLHARAPDWGRRPRGEGRRGRARGGARGRGRPPRHQPADVMLIEEHPFAKVLDFGISKIPEAEGLGGRIKVEVPTRLGTPGYVAPEQAKDPTSATRSADVYSLGVVLYQALSGTMPRGDAYGLEPAGEQVVDLATRRPEVPPALARAVMRCLSLDPAGRPSAEALARELAPFMEVTTGAPARRHGGGSRAGVVHAR